MPARPVFVSAQQAGSAVTYTEQGPAVAETHTIFILAAVVSLLPGRYLAVLIDNPERAVGDYSGPALGVRSSILVLG